MSQKIQFYTGGALPAQEQRATNALYFIHSSDTSPMGSLYKTDDAGNAFLMQSFVYNGNGSITYIKDGVATTKNLANEIQIGDTSLAERIGNLELSIGSVFSFVGNATAADLNAKTFGESGERVGNAYRISEEGQLNLNDADSSQVDVEPGDLAICISDKLSGGIYLPVWTVVQNNLDMDNLASSLAGAGLEASDSGSINVSFATAEDLSPRNPTKLVSAALLYAVINPLSSRMTAAEERVDVIEKSASHVVLERSETTAIGGETFSQLVSKIPESLRKPGLVVSIRETARKYGRAVIQAKETSGSSVSSAVFVFSGSLISTTISITIPDGQDRTSSENATLIKNELNNYSFINAYVMGDDYVAIELTIEGSATHGLWSLSRQSGSADTFTVFINANESESIVSFNGTADYVDYVYCGLVSNIESNWSAPYYWKKLEEKEDGVFWNKIN